MMDPAGTTWPAKTFTPSRLELESRPFLEEPRPFLCAIAYASCSVAGFSAAGLGFARGFAGAFLGAGSSTGAFSGAALAEAALAEADCLGVEPTAMSWIAMRGRRRGCPRAFLVLFLGLYWKTRILVPSRCSSTRAVTVTFASA